MQELQSKVEMPGSGPRLDSLELGSVWEQQQGLEKIRQKLLCVAGLLTSLVSHTMDRFELVLLVPASILPVQTILLFCVYGVED